jgi:hypothetical protein
VARARTTVPEPVAAGGSVAEIRERAAVRGEIERNALPDFLRFVRHLDNSGVGYEITSTTTLKIAHGLGRRHKGWFFTMNARSAGAPVIAEVRSDHASFDASVQDTHLQLISNSANASTVKVAVF